MTKRTIAASLVLTLAAGGWVVGAGMSASEAVVVKAARYLDVATGAYVDRAVVVIENGRITAAGSGLAVPAGVEVIDLGAATLLPGLIDAHTHLMLRLSDGQSYADNLLMKSEADRAMDGTANARATLRAGFTAVRDVENERAGYADVAPVAHLLRLRSLMSSATAISLFALPSSTSFSAAIPRRVSCTRVTRPCRHPVPA